MSRRWSHVVLLRGVNVGGKNLIKMAALQACLGEVQGLSDVQTFIQSGNALFAAKRAGAATLEARIEAAIAATFGCATLAVVVPADGLATIVAEAPRGFGKDPALRYDVLFLKRPLDAAAALPDVPARQGVDVVVAKNGVLYFSRRAADAAKSGLPRLVRLPLYKRLTIRNWNTTTKLAALLETEAEPSRRRRV